MYSQLAKEIRSRNDLEEFKESPAYRKYVDFVMALNESVKNLAFSHDLYLSNNILYILSVLDSLIKMVDEIPPVNRGESRFGNPSFTTWHNQLEKKLYTIHEPLIPHKAQIEIPFYLLNSFGNPERIDYGTGHEAHFIAWLYCLCAVGQFGPNDYPALVLRVFRVYVKLMQKLQTVYWLEPAGSHGVWGLDDYQFLPFLFGSAQLYDHKYIRTKDIHNEEYVEEFAKEYMYFSSIQFINRIKTVSLGWHSPLLNDISAVKTWQKTNQGMFKMYLDHVLNKLPIMQHFLFGSIFYFQGKGEMEHECVGCCHRVPSAVAALEHKMNNLIPFD